MAEMALQARVQGRVQGVGFRHFVVEKAQKLGLTGYVKNLDNGDVNVYAEGEEEELKQLLSYLNKGPFMARVNRVEKEWKEPEGRFSSFGVSF